MGGGIAPADADHNQGQARFIDLPSAPKLHDLLGYWTEKKTTRHKPSRSDIHPREIKTLLPIVHLWDGKPPYVIRLIGDHIVQFDGVNYTGQAADAGLPPNASTMLRAMLDQVVRSRKPLFRAGLTYWSDKCAYRRFEACYLPLSTGGESVDMILGGYVFDLLSSAKLSTRGLRAPDRAKGRR